MKTALLSFFALIFFTHCHHSTLEDSPQLSLVGLWENTDGPNTIEFDQDNNFILSFSGLVLNLKYTIETSEGQNQLNLYDSAINYEYDFSFLEGDQLRLDLRQVHTSFGSSSPLSSAIFQRVE
ncbi:MAG: hypothetical protein ACFB15_22955 [Cyclobacteriaceae bacterium]